MNKDLNLRLEKSLEVGVEEILNEELLTATSVQFPDENNESPIHGEMFSTLNGIAVNGRELLPENGKCFSIKKFSDMEEIVAVEVSTKEGVVTFFLNEYVPGKGWEIT
ncbi:hypothetical protein HYV12_03745 [Candidatus Dojkabacteria bacterium]|nr:hypothetical protein [Candidatus Dojkabacteria bacterium]